MPNFGLARGEKFWCQTHLTLSSLVGGIAGSALGAVLAREGVAVAVLERDLGTVSVLNLDAENRKAPVRGPFVIAPAQRSATGTADTMLITERHPAPSLFPIERLVGQLVGELFDFDFSLFDHWFGHLTLPQGMGWNLPARIMRECGRASNSLGGLAIGARSVCAAMSANGPSRYFAAPRNLVAIGE
jgi:hypothetical protein